MPRPRLTLPLVLLTLLAAPLGGCVNCAGWERTYNPACHLMPR